MICSALVGDRRAGGCDKIMLMLPALIRFGLATHAAMGGGLRLVRMWCILCHLAETYARLQYKTKLLPITAVG